MLAVSTLCIEYTAIKLNADNKVTSRSIIVQDCWCFQCHGLTDVIDLVQYMVVLGRCVTALNAG